MKLTVSQISMLLAIACYFVLLVNLLRKKRMNLKYTLLWLFSGFVMVFLVMFPKTLKLFAKVVGIYGETNALFATLFFCGIIILISLTAIVSKMTNRIVKLSQTIAILEKRIRDMEAKNKLEGTEVFSNGDATI